MSTMTTAASLLAKLRATAAPIQSAPARSNTKKPISEPDQETIRAYIEKHEAEWLGVFFCTALETGWRTNDIASLQWSSISFESGSADIVVQKQTRAAQARGYARGLKEIRESRMNACLAASDAAGFMRWSVATRDELAADASPAECDRLGYLVASSPVKRDQKRLSPALLARLKAMKQAAFWDDQWVFSRAWTSSNRTKLQSGNHITRSTMWARMRAVFAACRESLDAARVAAYSCYSLRKSFAVALYHAAGNSVAAVMRAMGHSSEAMSLRYMGLDDEAARVQANMVRGAA